MVDITLCFYLKGSSPLIGISCIMKAPGSSCSLLIPQKPPLFCSWFWCFCFFCFVFKILCVSWSCEVHTPGLCHLGPCPPGWSSLLQMMGFRSFEGLRGISTVYTHNLFLFCASTAASLVWFQILAVVNRAGGGVGIVQHTGFMSFGCTDRRIVGT